eukprot:15211266-Alexandrium_andersonii.AAC.1
MAALRSRSPPAFARAGIEGGLGLKRHQVLQGTGKASMATFACEKSLVVHSLAHLSARRRTHTHIRRDTQTH